MTDYDVIIIGGGPAGLSCAAELSKNQNLKILLIERNKIGNTNACWCVFEDDVKKNNLSSCVLNKANCAVMETYLGSKVIYNISQVTLDESKTLFLLKSRIGKNCAVKEGCDMYDYEKKKGVFHVNTNFGVFKSKYVFLATGNNSNLSKDFNLFVYSRLVKNIKSLDYKKNIVVDLMPNSNLWFFIEPVSKNEAWVGIEKHVKGEISKKYLDIFIKKYMNYKNINGDFGVIKTGYIPLNKTLKLKNDGVVRIGDALYLANSVTGYGFSKAIESGIFFASRFNDYFLTKSKKFDFKKSYDDYIKKYDLSYCFEKIALFIDYYSAVQDMDLQLSSLHKITLSYGDSFISKNFKGGFNKKDALILLGNSTFDVKLFLKFSFTDKVKFLKEVLNLIYLLVFKK